MRKREIHSVAHWAMMFLLLMFPLLMVGLSAFQNADYQPEVYYQEVTSDNFRINSTYQLTLNTNVNGLNTLIGVDDVEIINFSGDSIYNTLIANKDDITGIYFGNNDTRIYTGESILTRFSLQTYTGLFQFKLTSGDFNSAYSSNMTLLEYVDNYHYKNDVNLWTKQFLNLPINSWYKSLMNVIGVGFTNSSVMNVIYVMPVYILWVFIFDVIVDCFLVIIKLPHKLLNRLSGGENE